MFESHYHSAREAILFNGHNDEFIKRMWGSQVLRAGIDMEIYTWTDWFRELKAIIKISKQKRQVLNHVQGMGCYNIEELIRFARQDLKAASVFLGEKKYFMGDKPTVVDCAIFGHLVQTLYHAPTPGDAMRAFMVLNCENLVHFVERVRAEYFDDWDALCDEPIVIGDFKAFQRTISTDYRKEHPKEPKESWEEFMKAKVKSEK